MVQRSITVPDTRGYEPVVAYIQMARGVVLKGQVTDATTGKPLPGRIWVGPLFGNPYAEKPGYSSFTGYPEEDTGPDGRFRVVSIPGRVLLMVGPDYTQLPGGHLASLRYGRPKADPQFPDYFRSLGGGLMYRTKQGHGVIQGSYC
jgi:hypothetical protein